jgi:hypothetical protein
VCNATQLYYEEDMMGIIELSTPERGAWNKE